MLEIRGSLGIPTGDPHNPGFSTGIDYIILTNITMDSYNFPPDTTIPWYKDTGLKDVITNLKEALTC